MHGSAEVLVVMAKYPVPGAVKTRLAKRVGDERACALYTAFLRDIAARFRGSPWELVWAVDPPGSDLRAVVGFAGSCIDQEGRGLGERIRRCFEALFAAGARRVVMIGSDVPHLPVAVIKAAFAALEHDDVALAPSDDGGYCLVGMRGSHDIFSAVEMSTPQVFSATQQRLQSLKLRAHVLTPSFDVDDMNDVVTLDRHLRTSETELAHTIAVLNEWREAGLLSR